MISLVLAAAVSWPLQYNTGVAAYRSNDFSSASITFEQTTASPDRAMQQRAYYNLGNTSYRLGEAELRKAELTKAEQLWQRAIKNYESALVLNPKDEDARFNLGFVKQRMVARRGAPGQGGGRGSREPPGIPASTGHHDK